MRSVKSPRALFSIAVTLLMLMLAATTASAGESEKIIYSFNDHVGFAPSGLVLDAAGNLYGTTSAEVLTSPCTGTNARCGTVFELSRDANGNWVESDLLSFDGDDGSTPNGGLIFDSAGNLYGTTEYGGNGECAGYIRVGCGVVFELTPSSDGTWTEKVLYIFHGPDGAFPTGALTLDASGNLYGATYIGGSGTCPAHLKGNPSGCGVIFELSPTRGGAWTQQVLHSFANDGMDGTNANGGLVFDASGNMYGTTTLGGSYNQGTVFEMTPNAGGWNEEVLYSFGVTSADGTEPVAGVVLGTGNLYGQTFYGGVQDRGSVFELRRRPGGSWAETLLYEFGRRFGGGNPEGGLVFDGSGNLYGTAESAGLYLAGLAFELSPNDDGDWQLTVLHDFDIYPGDGIYPNSLVLDLSGNIYCPTSDGGSHDLGAIVEILN